MSKLELLQHYNKIFLFSDHKPPSDWPNDGKIIFQNLYLRYSADTPHVLKNLNIIIEPMEKVIFHYYY